MRKPGYRRLRPEDRHVIGRLSKAGMGQSQIAHAVGFSQSTISKELRRNASPEGYSAEAAQGLAERRGLSKRPRGRAISGEVAVEVERLLRLKYSPEQISATMGPRGPSHQSIYRHVERDRLEGGDLRGCLRINGRRRRLRRKRGRVGRIAGRVDISERPSAINRRERYGDWEADLVMGRLVDRGCVLTLVERKSRLALAEKIDSKDSSRVAKAILARLEGFKVLSLTFDNGLEFSEHRLVAETLRCRAYFCRPYRSCDKGAVENYNGLLRQYIPKERHMRDTTAKEVRYAESQLNLRPRKTLGFKSPLKYIAKIATVQTAINFRAYSLEV